MKYYPNRKNNNLSQIMNEIEIVDIIRFELGLSLGPGARMVVLLMVFGYFYR